MDRLFRHAAYIDSKVKEAYTFFEQNQDKLFTRAALRLKLKVSGSSLKEIENVLRTRRAIQIIRKRNKQGRMTMYITRSTTRYLYENRPEETLARSIMRWVNEQGNLSQVRLIALLRMEYRTISTKAVRRCMDFFVSRGILSKTARGFVYHRYITEADVTAYVEACRQAQNSVVRQIMALENPLR